jgi:hypothetical protein
MISLSYLQLLIGSDSSFFHLPYPKYAKWIEQGWLTSLWKFLHQTKLQLNVRNHWKPTLQREWDIMLMDYFISLKYNPQDLKILNHCRIYLQVYSLIDLAAADGRTLLSCYKLGEFSQDRKSPLTWPIQQRPGKAAWRLWTTALQHLEHNERLKTPLGRWQHPPHQNWHWFLDNNSSVLYHITPEERWCKCPPLGPIDRRSTRRSTIIFYNTTKLSPTEPPRQPIFPATLDSDNITALTTVIPGPAYLPIPRLTKDTPQNPHDHLTNHPFYARLLGPITDNLHDIHSQICDAISQHSLHICTDGSFNPSTSQGAHGWVLASPSTTL